MGSSSPMALQKSFTLPASTVVLKGLNSWPITFLSSCIVFPPMMFEHDPSGPSGHLPSFAGEERRAHAFPRLRGKVARSAGRGLLVAADEGDPRHVLARRAAPILGHAHARNL